MRFALASDIHLEFGSIELENTNNADVLVLAGDICVATRLGEKNAIDILGENNYTNRVHKFFQEVCERFPHVVYIMGNHEHYDGDFAISHTKLVAELCYLKNLHILDKEVFVFDDVTFIGGTLWTDMNNEDPLTLHAMKSMMNDFRCVDNSSRQVEYKTPLYETRADGYEKHYRNARFTPEDAVVDHRAMREYIQHVIEGKHNQKFVVVGHHAPSKSSTHPRYKDEQIMNGGYSTSIDEYILDHPQIKVWVHGHTHEDFDYMVGSTRIVCNPRGYINYEDRADRFELKYIDV
jgi:Icc-related predicted phosphoesterase